jgi:hypothetical protein
METATEAGSEKEAVEPLWSPQIQEEIAIDRGLGDTRGTLSVASTLDLGRRFIEFVL